jgi:hypothetical protein
VCDLVHLKQEWKKENVVVVVVVPIDARGCTQVHPKIISKTWS